MQSITMLSLRRCTTSAATVATSRRLLHRGTGPAFSSAPADQSEVSSSVLLLSRRRYFSGATAANASRCITGGDAGPPSGDYRGVGSRSFRISSTSLNVRLLSSASGSGGGGGGGDKSDGEDPFGVNYNDNNDDDTTTSSTGGGLNLGPDKPPALVRDATTGKLTGEIESELTDKERRLLNLTQADRTRVLADRFVSSWNKEEEQEDAEHGGEGGSSREAEVAERIRTEQIALNVIGRGSADVATSLDQSESGGDYVDPAKFTAPLSPAEFRTLRRYAEQEHGLDDVSEDDIPVSRAASGADAASSSGGGPAATQSDPDLDLTWLTAAARAEVEGPSADDILGDPFVDLMPSDLNPARKVNRKRAKALPRQLLHHNNLSLLRRFVTPGGQIMNRVRTRLGAKDQRKVAKLIKRARHLGLIPHLGQWKLEDHGNMHEDDIAMEREWEKELAARGLLERRGSNKST